MKHCIDPGERLRVKLAVQMQSWELDFPEREEPGWDLHPWDPKPGGS